MGNNGHNLTRMAPERIRRAASATCGRCVRRWPTARALGVRFYLPYLLAISAEIYLELESIDAALELVADGHRRDWVHRRVPVRSRAASPERRAFTASGPSSQSAAERSFRTAIEVAQAHQAKSLELRATMSLARLLDKQGKREDARAMLADIYNWFTEGFDTADLKDAKALLEELKG